LIDLGYDTTLDDSVLTTNISGVTFLRVERKEISDLTGIEAFVALEELFCNSNLLTSLDMSKNTALVKLSCNWNKLTSLDVSKNTALTNFSCSYNQLTSLDVSKNTALEELFCNRNKLTSLDVSKNTALTNFSCSSNQLTSLDVSANTALIHLYCNTNQLTSLDVSNNTALTWLVCNTNQLTSLDVSKNTALKSFSCSYNQLTNLDVSKNTALEELFCYSNQLTSLDVSNNTALVQLVCNRNKLTSLDVSNNTALARLDCYGNQLTSLIMRNGLTDQLSEKGHDSFDATRNSGLTCIETLDPAYATTNWTSAEKNINAGVTFSVICGAEAVTKWHVATTGSDGSGGGTEASPLATIQTGINAASSGDTVSVSAGTYKENIDFKGKNIVVLGENKETTIIDGNQNGTVVIMDGNDTQKIIGFSIINGDSWGQSSRNGGGIKISGSPSLKNLILRNNIAKNQSGEMGQGGGIYMDNASPNIDNVTFINNSAYEGSAICSNNQSKPIINNILVYNNSSTSGGTLSFAYLNQVTITNSTIVNNIITSRAIINLSNSSLDVINSIIRSNHNDIFYLEGDYTLNCTYSNIEGGYTGTGNIDSDPKFVKVVTTGDEESDYHLKDSSPAIGAGTATGAPTTDIEGNPRPNPAGSNPDMGAFENKWGTPQNATPVITAMSDVTVNEDESYSDTLRATDEEGDAITYSAVSDTSAVTASVTDSLLTLTPKANWHGVANIKTYASDGTSKDSTLFKLTVTPVDDIAAVQDVTIDEDKSAEVTLTSTFSGTTTFTAVSDTNAVTISVSSSTLTLTPTANWHGVANIKAYASDGNSKDSTTFKLTVTPVQDAPTAFDWVSSALDTINIIQSNLADTYTLQWDASTDVDGDSINYLIYAKIGLYPTEEVEEITDTAFQLIYEEILENVFEGSPVNGATVSLNVKATDGIDTVDVTGDNRVIYVNRYEYLSTESEGVPVEFALHENYPNPFNPTTTLRFDLPEVSDITLTIYNMLGQKVKIFNMQSTPAGYHAIKWNGKNDNNQSVSGGVYIYKLQSRQKMQMRKMILLK
jgi:hypothetical protein